MRLCENKRTIKTKAGDKHLDTIISRNAKDIIQKYTSGLFKDATLEFYGIKTAKIKELISPNIPVVEVSGSDSDFVFLLEDDSYLHFEFQSSYNDSDLIRFAHYDLRLHERDKRTVKTVIIYTADVKEAPSELKAGSVVFSPENIMMVQYDGNAIYNELVAKIKSGAGLTDVDMLNLIFLPLMSHSIPQFDLAVDTIKLAQTIPDTTRRNTCTAAAVAFANKYLGENKLNELLEVLNMTDVYEMIAEKYEKWASKKNSTMIAKKLLKRGMSVEAVAEDTELDEATVKELQEELNCKK